MVPNGEKEEDYFMNPNKENMFKVPNHEMKRDYYLNLCLSQLKNELQF